jgi:hypothetical protein
VKAYLDDIPQNNQPLQSDLRHLSCRRGERHPNEVPNSRNECGPRVELHLPRQHRVQLLRMTRRNNGEDDLVQASERKELRPPSRSGPQSRRFGYLGRGNDPFRLVILEFRGRRSRGDLLTRGRAVHDPLTEVDPARGRRSRRLLRPVGDDVPHAVDTRVIVKQAKEILDELVASQLGHERGVPLDELIERVNGGNLEGTTRRDEMESEGGDQLGDVDRGGSEHEELLRTLDSLDRDPIVLLERELVDEEEDQRSDSSRLLQLRSDDAHHRAQDLADDLVRREVTSDVDAPDGPSLWLVRVQAVDVRELTKGALDERLVRKTRRRDDPRETLHAPEVDDRVRIVREGEENIDHRLEERATDERTDVGVDRAEGKGATGSGLGVSVVDD